MHLVPISSDDASLEVTSVLHELARDKRRESGDCLAEVAIATGFTTLLGIAGALAVRGVCQFYPSMRMTEVVLALLLSVTCVVVGKANVISAMQLWKRRRELRSEVAQLDSMSRAIEDRRANLQRAINTWNAEFQSLSADLQSVNGHTTPAEKVFLKERGDQLEEARRVLEPHLDTFRTQLPTLARAAILGKSLA